MRKLIAWVFIYSMAFSPTRATEYWQFCFGLPVDPAAMKEKIGLYESAYAHIIGRVCSTAGTSEASRG